MTARNCALVLCALLLCVPTLVSAGRPAELAPPLTPGEPTSLPGRAPIVLYASRGMAPFRVEPPAQPSMPGFQSATINVNYLAAGTKNMFGDACEAWPASARTAFTYAAGIWGRLLNSSVPIRINACWAKLPTGALGHSGAVSFHRGFAGATAANTWYSAALANALSGAEQNDHDGPDDDGDGSDADAEMEIAYASSGISWYFGTDGHPSMGQYDLVSVVLHEIAHGLDFAGSMTVSGGAGSWGGGTGNPVIYDRFARDGNGTELLNTGAYLNPSIALGNALTGKVGGGVYFEGPNAMAANGGNRVKLYTPSTWKQGSSYAHLDVTFDGTPNALMTWSLDGGEAVHNPGAIACGVLQDIGWPGGCSSAPTAPSNLTAAPASTTQVSLSWSDNSVGESGFEIERSPDGISNWLQIASVAANATAYTDLGVTCNTPYYYRVRAYAGAVSSSYSNAAYATTPVCAPAPDVSILKEVIGIALKPGDRITFTLTIANLGNAVAARTVVTDTLPAQVLTPTYASTLVITPTGGSIVLPNMAWNVQMLPAGASGVITIYGQIDPALPAIRSFANSATIWDPEDVTPGNNTSRVTVGAQKVHLPLVTKLWPPIPDAPLLNGISNPDGDGNYTVTWSAAARATAYVLQEDDSASFPSPTTLYAGPNTTHAVTDRSVSTWWYRVRASNAYGTSPWSTPQSVVVQPPTPTPWPRTCMYVVNDTGCTVCYEVKGTGFGKKCYASSGTHFYGCFSVGRYSSSASACCGSRSETLDFPAGNWQIAFSCRSDQLVGETD